MNISAERASDFMEAMRKTHETTEADRVRIPR